MIYPRSTNRRLRPMWRLLPVVVLSLAPGAAHAQVDRDSLSRLAEADADRNGRITRAEVIAERAARFPSLDRNRDGAISKEDLSGIAGFAPGASRQLEQLKALADANRDGRVTRAEFQAAPMPVFNAVDSNRDGVVDRAELAAARRRLS